MADPIATAIDQLQMKLDRHAHDNMEYPKSDPYEHGVKVGQYWGVLDALKVLRDVLAADAEAAAKL